MAGKAKVTSYPHIEKTPGVRAGKACILGTRLSVVDIVISHQQGYTPQELQTLFGSRPLTLAEVFAALAYHYDHPEELEDYLRRSEQMEIESARAERLSHRGQ
jgi:uncharacterized protein (DUF433 family)